MAEHIGDKFSCQDGLGTQPNYLWFLASAQPGTFTITARESRAASAWGSAT
jgi:hypothetical protein